MTILIVSPKLVHELKWLHGILEVSGSGRKLSKKAILDEELGYIERGDLIYVTPKPDSALRGLLTGVASKRPPWFRRHPPDAAGYDPRPPCSMMRREQRAFSRKQQC